MKNKGFTLVELLAVIAILAILVIMALPAVLRMYRQSRINNFQNEVRGVYKAAQQQFLSDSMLLESGQKILYTNVTSCTPTGVDEVKQLDMTGNTDFKYYVLMNVDGKVLNVRATNGTYSYSLKTANAKNDLKIENIEVETNNQSTLDSDIANTLCPNEEDTYSPHIAICVEEGCTKTATGTLLEIGGEQFYVIGSEGANTRLLTKNAINKTSNNQVTNNTYTIMAFSSIGYWDGSQCVRNGSSLSCPGTSGLLSPYNNSSNAVGKTGAYSENPYPYVYNENSNLKTIVDAYASKIGTLAGDTTITGTLMTYEEANGLDSSIINCGQHYWLGSAKSNSTVCFVNAGGIVSYTGLNNTVGGSGVRPVIIVSTFVL